MDKTYTKEYTMLLGDFVDDLNNDASIIYKVEFKDHPTDKELREIVNVDVLDYDANILDPVEYDDFWGNYTPTELIDMIHEDAQDKIFYEKLGDNNKEARSNKMSIKKKADYQGWTNHSTWAVALWIDDDQGLREEVFSNAATMDNHELQDYLKDLVEEGNPLLEDSSMYSDLLSGAISEVNWYELATTYIDQYNEEKKYNDEKSLEDEAGVGTSKIRHKAGVLLTEKGGK